MEATVVDAIDALCNAMVKRHALSDALDHVASLIKLLVCRLRVKEAHEESLLDKAGERKRWVL